MVRNPAPESCGLKDVSASRYRGAESLDGLHGDGACGAGGDGLFEEDGGYMTW